MANDRTIAISGFIFAIATFIGLVLLVGGAAVGDTTTAEAATWLEESGHRTRMLVGAYVMCGGAIVFLVFASGVMQRLRHAEAPGVVLSIAQFGAIAFSILTLAAAVGMASAAYAVASNVEPTPIDPGALRIGTYGFALWAIPAALAGGTFVAAVSIAAFVSGAFPRWLALIGFLIAALSTFGITFLPTPGVFVWAILVAIVTVVRGEAGSPVRAGALAGSPAQRT